MKQLLTKTTFVIYASDCAKQYFPFVPYIIVQKLKKYIFLFNKTLFLKKV